MPAPTHPRIVVTAKGVTIEKDPHTAPIHLPPEILAANSAMVRHLGEVEGAAQLTLTLLAGSLVIESTPRAFWETADVAGDVTIPAPVIDHMGGDATVASTYARAAWNLRHGYPVGGSNTTESIARTLEAISVVLDPQWAAAIGASRDLRAARQRQVEAERELATARTSSVAQLNEFNAALNSDAAIDVAHIERQRAFSEWAFGPGVRTAGVLDHLAKELEEIREAPHDVSEWADVIILAIDGAWRSGATPEEIIAAIKAKQSRNEARSWPDWRTADPDKAIEHIRTNDSEANQ